jgi:hypothetical protein
MAAATRLTLVTRVDCGLCEELARDLSRLGVSFSTLDVDADPELTRLYDDCVPVLLQDGRELARAPLAEPQLRQTLRQAGALP